VSNYYSDIATSPMHVRPTMRTAPEK